MAMLLGDTDLTGADESYFFTNANLAVTEYTALLSGTAETASTPVRDSADATDLVLVVYASTAGAPGAELGVTVPITDVGVGQGGWKQAAFVAPFELVAGTKYFGGFLSYGDTLNGYGKLGVGQVGRGLPGGTSTPPNPFGTPSYSNAPPEKGVAFRIDGTESGGEEPGDDQFVRVGGVWVPCDRKARAGGAWI